MYEQEIQYMKDMRLTRFAIVSIILAIFVLFPAAANSAPSRKPIKFYCNLIKKSKILFWNYETTRSVQIDIYDSNKNGEYDTYKWWEDGAVRHKGDFFNSGDDSLCENKLGKTAVKMLTAYYNDKDDEYFIKIKSKKDNSNIGHFIIDSDFKKNLTFERYYIDYMDGTVLIPYGPSKDPLKYNIFLKFRVDRLKNKLRNTNLYIRYDDKRAVKSYVNYEDHRIVISDVNQDGVFDQCMYVIDECEFAIGTKFAYNIPSNVLWNIFYKEIRNNDIKVMDFIDGEYRIPLHSLRNNFVIGYLDFKSYGNLVVTYRGITKFSDPNISTAAKFGFSIQTTSYLEYANFAGSEPGFLDPHLRRYRSNVFINEYLKERERASHSRKQETIFSMASE